MYVNVLYLVHEWEKDLNRYIFTAKYMINFLVNDIQYHVQNDSGAHPVSEPWMDECTWQN
jgi:hypothetical protein